jgi:hypothetical protein
MGKVDLSGLDIGKPSRSRILTIKKEKNNIMINDDKVQNKSFNRE